MHTAQALQTSATGSVFFNVWDDNCLVAADQNVRYPALAVDQETNLTADFDGKLANGLAEFWRDDKGGCSSPTIEIVQAADLAGLQSTYLSVDLD
jgi:hypothetical protein